MKEATHAATPGTGRAGAGGSRNSRPVFSPLGVKTAILILLCGLGLACSKQDSSSKSAEPKEPHSPGTTAAIPEDALVPRGITPGRKGGKLVMGIAGDPKTFNPLFCDDVVSQKVNDYIFDKLYDHDRFRKVDVPRLAKSWEFDKEKLEWTFHLRKNLFWSDGHPLTADDFLFTAEAANDDKVPTTLKEYLKTGDARYVFSAPDPLTLVVRIPQLDSFSLLNLIELKPMPRHIYEKRLRAGTFAECLGTNTPPAEIISSGPMRVKEYRSGEKVVLEANPYSYEYDEAGQRLPYLDQFVLLNVEDFDAMALRFQSGDLDLLEEIHPHNLALLQDGQTRGNYTVLNPGLSLANNHYWFNLRPGGSYEKEKGKRENWDPPAPGAPPPPEVLSKGFRYYVDPAKLESFQNEDFRKACSMATNRDAVVKTVLYGEAVPIYGFTTPGDANWYNPGIPTFPYDPAKAAATLDRIGFRDRDGDGLREDAKGRAFRFTLITNKENRVREKIGVLLKEDLRKIGLDATLQLLDFNDIITRLHDTSDYEACLLGLESGVPPHPAQSANIWLSSSRMHTWHPNEPTPATPWEAELDRLFNSLKETFEIPDQKRIYDQMQVIWAEHQPVIHISTLKLYVAAANRVGNLKPTVLRPFLTHNIQELYLKDK